MSTTLSFGFVKPSTGDKGSVVFDALEGDITQLNSHDHDGTDSDRIDAFDLRRGSVSVTNSGWSSFGELYQKTVSFPSGFSAANGSSFGSASIRFFLSGGSMDGAEVFPTIAKASATSLILYSPFSNQAFTVVFT